MDIFAHALWTNALARLAKRKAAKAEKYRRYLLSIGWATFWGVFPDLFAFTVPFVIGIFGWISGNGFIYGRDSIASGLAPSLYNYSHSLVIWAVVFMVAWIISKRPRWELLGWALHILIDVPTHAANFYATPVLFPISNWKFLYGISWATPWFMIVNYSALFVTWSGIGIHVLVTQFKNKK
jgi:hypothetical protein